MLFQNFILKTMLSLEFFRQSETENPQILTGVQLADGVTQSAPRFAGPSARASSSENLKGPVFIGLIFLMLIEFTIQFLMAWFFGWILMKVIGLPFVYFAAMFLSLFFAICWFGLYPSTMQQLERAKQNYSGERLTGAERSTYFRQMLIGYLINVVISVVVLTLVARILNVPMLLPNGQPLPLVNFDTTEIITTLAVAFGIRVLDALFGSGSRAASLPYASILSK